MTAQRLAIADDALEDVYAYVMAQAADRGLVVVPSVPDDGGHCVVLGPGDLTAGAFTELAVKAGARMFYVGRGFLETGATAQGDVVATPRDLQDQICSHEGQLASLELAFCVDAVLHVWEQQSSWSLPLRRRLDELAEELDEDCEASFGQDEPDRLSQDRIDQMVAELVALPDFREAGSQARQRVVAYQAFPELASARNSWQVLEAEGLARQAAYDRAYADWDDRLPELAQELAATPEWKGATTVRTRTYRAQDFLRDRAGGYPPAKRMVDLLLETPGLSRSRRT